jgi:hypothetical protein
MQKSPGIRVIKTRVPGLFPFAADRRSPWAFAQKETRRVSSPSLTPVVTGATGVFGSDPVIRFQQAIDLDLKVRELQRQVQRLSRQLSPAPHFQSPPRRRSRRPGW